MEILDNPYQYIYKKCSDNNIPMDTLCKKLKISRANLKRWREHSPKSIQILAAIENYFQSLESSSDSK